MSVSYFGNSRNMSNPPPAKRLQFDEDQLMFSIFSKQRVFGKVRFECCFLDIRLHLTDNSIGKGECLHALGNQKNSGVTFCIAVFGFVVMVWNKTCRIPEVKACGSYCP